MTMVKLQVERPFKNGKKDGLEKGHYESGKLQYETPFKDDNMNGIGKSYDEKGALIAIIPYVNGKATRCNDTL